MRNLRKKEDKFNSIIAGFISGLSYLIDKDPSRAKLFTVFMFVRSIQSLIELGSKNSYFEKRKKSEVIIFTLFNCFAWFQFIFDFNTCPTWLRRTVSDAFDPSKNEEVYVKMLYRMQAINWLSNMDSKSFTWGLRDDLR